ncbi:MAG: histidine kinase [Ilumatobacter sp.]|uniref:sensor histidine kinase n=1 Tax=Ilumatobacter sp. TaxID=1967498 RepID=UPI00261DFCD6|nr:histidine kinase [Ilumatobacter sp.]MDJ0769300.1 histidine kinase [Ilumatobacter sp.]
MKHLPPPTSATVRMGDPSFQSGAERETGRVSQFPPPPPPPTPRASATEGWDWDRARDVAEKWFRPLAQREGWLALAFLFLSAIVAPFLFAAMVALGAITFGLLFIVVGFFLIVPFFAMIGVFAKIEREFAALAGHRIEPRAVIPVNGIGPRAILTTITDPARWRQVAFVAVNVVLGPVLLAFGSFPLSIVLQTVFGDTVIDGPGFTIGTGFSTGAFGIFALVLAAFAAGAIPRVAIWVADLKAQIDVWFLGTDRLAIAEQRVTTLSTQRQDILDAVASERRRIERNLHDGVQQQLVAIGLDLGMAEHQIDDDPQRAKELLGSARQKVQGSIGELRQLGRGLHPAILADRGIDAALSAVVSSAPIPISVHVDADLDMSTDVAETIYFVANEAIANVLKHADARVASVHVMKVAANVRVTVHDDGRGGADAGRGTGIAGIRARVNAFDGTLSITSPDGGPTTLIAELPRHGR